MNHSPINIVLISPPFQHFPGMKYFGDKYTRPPLGIAYLASYLRIKLRNRINISLIDCEAEKISFSDRLIKKIISKAPNIVGFSVVTGTFTISSNIALTLKSVNKNIITIAGGPHITALPDEYMPGIDVKVFGEGEVTFYEYISEIYLGASSRDIEGCIRFRGNEIISRGKIRDLITNLDDIPIPSRDLLPPNSYFHTYPYPGRTGYTTMLVSRGCPYSCNFCANETLWGKKVRFHSVERILQEIDLVYSKGINLVFFDDDTFIVNKDRVFTICKNIREKYQDFKWICHTRADTIDKELLLEMKSAGCVELQIGVESGDPDVLKKTDKSITIEKITEAFHIIKQVKINTWVTFMLGNTGETDVSIRRSIKFAKRIDPTYCAFIVLLPFPGARIFEEYKKAQFITTYDWSKYSWYLKPVISTNTLSDKDLIMWRKKANLHFYMRPRKLTLIALNVIRAMSLREIIRSFRAWISLLLFNEKYY